MTREQYEEAEKVIVDIQSLKIIQQEFKNNHWVSFYGAVEGTQPITTGTLREDLKKFVDDEIEKLEKELEQI